MTGHERAVLAAMAPAALRTAAVAWAGARSAALGSQLHRDGALARMTVRDGGVEAIVHEGGAAHRIFFEVRSDRLQASCTCESAPCSHATCALLELQKRARQARDADQQQSVVLATLRDRLGSAKLEAAPAKTKILSNLERLPLEAGVDMVALAWRQGLRHGPLEICELTQLVERLEAHAVKAPQPARELALRLLTALAAKRVVFVPLPEEAETAAIRLVPIVAGQDPKARVPTAEVLAEMVDLALGGHAQVSAHLAAGLDVAAMRSPPWAEALAAVALARIEREPAVWREVAVPAGRDRLFSALVAARLQQDDLAGALDLAHAWPPMRQALQMLATALGRAGRHDEVVRLAGHYDPRAELWGAGMRAAAEAALDAGFLTVAARLAAWAFELQPAEVWFDLLARMEGAGGPGWPERRGALVAHLLSEEDPPWLADRLAQEPDAADALLHAIVTAPLRERTARASLLQLREHSPLLALHGASARLVALAAAPGTTARVFKDELARIELIADEAQEPGLFRDFAKLLSRECAERAPLATALAAAIGRGA